MNTIIYSPIFLIILIYITGYITTLNFLKHFGKNIGLDYQNYSDNYFVRNSNFFYSIWSNETDACTSLSIFWPLFLTIGLLYWSINFFFWFLWNFILNPIYNLLKKLTNLVIK